MNDLIYFRVAFRFFSSTFGITMRKQLIYLISICLLTATTKAQSFSGINLRIIGPFGSQNNVQRVPDKNFNGLQSKVTVSLLGGAIAPEWQLKSSYVRTYVGYSQQHIQYAQQYLSATGGNYSFNQKIAATAMEIGLGWYKRNPVFSPFLIQYGFTGLLDASQQNSYYEQINSTHPNGVYKSTEKQNGPLFYSMSLLFNTGLYYPIYKNILIGLEFENGLAFAYQNGKQKLTIDEYDSNGNSLSTYSGTSTVDYKAVGRSFYNMYLTVHYTVNHAAKKAVNAKRMD